MDFQEFHFRRASMEDASALGELIYIAAQGNYATSGYSLSIGGSRDYQISRLASLATAIPPSWFHYSHCSVVEHAGRVVAGLAGFHKASIEVHIAPALREIGWTDFEIQILNRMLDPISRCFPIDPPGAWTIDHVAVIPQFRRRGLLRQLLTAEIERARGAGYRIAQLDVFSTNAPAIAAYQGAGFQRTVEFGDATFQRLLGRDPMWRLTRGLGRLTRGLE